MSWAGRRRFLYVFCIILFFAVVIGVPVYFSMQKPPTCTDGILNLDETSIDRGGSCPLLDERFIQPVTSLWTRVFKVRDGLHSVVTYIQNSNRNAALEKVTYRFQLFDAKNVQVAERIGTSFIMPGGLTPIFEPNIETGNRDVQRAFFEILAREPWVKTKEVAEILSVENKEMKNETVSPRLEATLTNTGVKERTDISMVAVIFDTAGNAITASGTFVKRIQGGETQSIVFTWPKPFGVAVSRIDIIPRVPPTVE